MTREQLATTDLKSLTFESALAAYTDSTMRRRDEINAAVQKFGADHMMRVEILPDLQARKLRAIRWLATKKKTGAKAGRPRRPKLVFSVIRTTGETPVPPVMTLDAVHRVFDSGTPKITHITPLLIARVAAGHSESEFRGYKFVLTERPASATIPV